MSTKGHTGRGYRAIWFAFALQLRLMATVQVFVIYIKTDQHTRCPAQNVTCLISLSLFDLSSGCVVGLLKVGTKSLYVFDPNGETRQVNAPCVLDFYVHESRQRSGLGKTLFESMLTEQKYKPSKMAIDRPSEKLIGFFNKHYGDLF